MTRTFTEQYFSPVRVCGIYFICCLIFIILFWWNGYDTYSFGWEMGNIASALVSNRGFADAFGEDTGPTSWFPPLYALAEAGIFQLFGNRTIVSYWTVHVLNVLIMTVALYFLYNINFSRQLNRFKILLLPTFGFLSIFILMKDFEVYSWTVLQAILVVYLFAETMDHGFKKNRYIFYLLAIVLPFSNISLLLGFAGLLGVDIILSLIKKHHYIPVKHSFFLLCILGLCVFTWGIRNQNVLGKFIPNKSNLWFEFYLSNVDDRDGIIKQSNWKTAHPLSDSTTRALYVQMGEVMFVDSYKEVSFKYLKENWDDYLRKVFRRALNSFVYVTTSADIIDADVNSFVPSDSRKLKENGLLQGNIWLCADMPGTEFKEKINQLDLFNPMPVIVDWETKSEMVHKAMYWSPKSIVGGIFLSSIPSVALILCFFLKSIRKSKVFLLSLFFYLLSIGPYILVSHYARYQTFQIGFFSIFIFLSMAYFLDKITWQNPGNIPSTEGEGEAVPNSLK